MRRCGVISGTLALLLAQGAGAMDAPSIQRTRQETLSAVSRLPLHFEPNVGQTDPRAGFITQGPGCTLFLSPAEAMLRLTRTAMPASDAAAPARETSLLRMRLVGADGHAAGSAEGPLSGRANYLRGPDPAGWVTGVPYYRQVRYRSVYPGVDLLYYGRQGALEVDFVLAAGADASRVRLAFDGASSVRVRAGRLTLGVGSREVAWAAPVAYQTVAGARRRVASAWRTDGRRAWFDLGAYDRSRTLVIDPQLDYSTYLGGKAMDTALDIGLDDARCAYVTGATDSVDYPTVPGAFQGLYNGGTTDAFVTKLEPKGRWLVYSTYLGSPGEEWGYGIDVSINGHALVTGWTDDKGFPTTPGCFDAVFNGATDAFVSVLTPNGAGLAYSTYLGGGLKDQGREIRWGIEQTLHIDGFTESRDFPTTPGAFDPVANGGYDAFYTKLKPMGQGIGDLAYSTYIGGEADDFGLCMDLWNRNMAYLGGSTSSVPFPVSQAPFQPLFGGTVDGFVFVINPQGQGGADMVYSSYIGGQGTDECLGIVVADQGHAYVTGYTDSFNFPIRPGAFQPVLAPPKDAIVFRFIPANGGPPDLQASTYLGGPGPDEGHDIDVSWDEPYLVGWTASQAFPVTATAFQPILRGPVDAFVTRMVPFLNAPIYSTYLGGDIKDMGYGIRLDADANATVCGNTDSANFPVTATAFDITFNGVSDAFVTRLAIGRGTDVAVAAATGAIGATVALKAQLTYSFDGSPIGGKPLAFDVDGIAVGSANTDATGWASVNYVISEGAGPGARTITATFAGDASAGAGSGSNVLRVTMANTGMWVPDRAGTITDTIRLKAFLWRLTDSGWLAGKTVAFSVDGTAIGSGVTDASGMAYLDWVMTAGAASRVLRGDFAGDTWYNACFDTATLTCNTLATKMYAPDRTGAIADYTILKAWLYRMDSTGVPGKTLRFRIDGTAVGTAVTNVSGGAALFYTIPEGAGSGNRVIRAEWDGDAGYTASFTTAKLTVTKAPVYIWPYARTVKQGTTAYPKAYLRRLPDYVILVGKTLAFDVDGSSIGSAATDATGWATVTWAVPPTFPTGAHTLGVAFAGDGSYLAGTASAGFNCIP